MQSGTPPPLATLGSLESNVVKPDSISLTMDGLKVTRDVRATAQVAAPRGAKHGLRFGLSAFVESKRATLPEPSSAVGYVTFMQGCIWLNQDAMVYYFELFSGMCSSRKALVCWTNRGISSSLRACLTGQHSCARMFLTVYTRELLLGLFAHFLLLCQLSFCGGQLLQRRQG